MTYNAIFTRYLGATTHKGSRIKATCRGVTATVPLDYSLNLIERHEVAARAVAGKLGWLDADIKCAGEGLDGRDYVFIAIGG